MGERVVCDPAILGGVPIIEGTRMPVTMILTCMADGMSPHDIIREYDHINYPAIMACLQYAAEHLSPSPSLEETEKAVIDGMNAALVTHLISLRPEHQYAIREHIIAHLQQHIQTTPAPQENGSITLSERPDYVVGQAPAGVPTRCPVTGLQFFSIERNPDGPGFVPTYGGPFDSFTIPKRCEDSDSGRECRRFDHDAGHWVDEWEDVPESQVKTPATTKEGNDHA